LQLSLALHAYAPSTKNRTDADLEQSCRSKIQTELECRTDRSCTSTKIDQHAQHSTGQLSLIRSRSNARPCLHSQLSLLCEAGSSCACVLQRVRHACVAGQPRARQELSGESCMRKQRRERSHR